MLVRYRLHASAAYLRKYSRVEEVQKTTRVRPLNHTLHPISQPAKTARDHHLHRVPKVPEARGRHAFEKPVCEGDACGVCHVQGGGGEMFHMVRGFGSCVGRRGCAERCGGLSVIFPSGRCSFGVRSVRTGVIKIVTGGTIWSVRWLSFRCR